MTEAEAYELVVLIASELNQLMFGYFSVVSAFLIVSYLVADKLTAFQSAIVISLYTLCAVYVVLNVYALNTDLDSIYAEMLAKKESGDYALEWFGKNPIWIPMSLTVVQTGIGLGGYIGSVIFFYSNRRARRGLEGGAT